MKSYSHIELLHLVTYFIKQIQINMGQFIDYLTSVFTSSGGHNNNNKVEQANSNHVTFADNSFAHVFGGSSSKHDAQLLSITKSNRNTIYLYEAIVALSCLIQLFMVTMPKVRVETFDFMQPEGWQLITLSVIPLIIYSASLGAMHVVQRPLNEGVKLTSKNSSGLDLNNNEFIYSLKIVILLVAICQVSSIFSDHFIWSVVMIVSNKKFVYPNSLSAAINTNHRLSSTSTGPSVVLSVDIKASLYRVSTLLSEPKETMG